MVTNAQAIALNRFGLGTTADPPPDDPRRWLEDQLGVRPAVEGKQREVVVGVFRRQVEIRAAGRGSLSHKAAQETMRTANRAIYFESVESRFRRAFASLTPFTEHLVHFWSNHFAVSVEGKALMAGLAGTMEEEAIRPNVFGRFTDMLLAVERHAAMQIYLDQAISVGPKSPYAQKYAGRGLNENLAREILELHTLGVRSGYTEADVTELARALTGWTIVGALPGDDAEPLGSFGFAADRHEPGARTILGRNFPDGGEGQAADILIWLATRPETARYVATKLCRHFVADEPAEGLIKRVADAYLGGDGQLEAVYRALIAAPEAWSTPFAKFRTPWEWLVAAARLTGSVGQLSPAALLQKLGQRVWSPGSPAGWPDLSSDWAAPDALLRRVELAPRLAAGIRDDARRLTKLVKVEGGSTATDEIVARADSRGQALALLLVAPEMLRR